MPKLKTQSKTRKTPISGVLNFTGKKPRFWHFNQNNSGGSFIQDHENGISHHVVIEAESATQANEIAESIGIYFNGCSDGRDCDCCGDRWSSAYGEGDKKPSVYGQDVSKGKISDLWIVWMKDGIEGYIHYLNGKVKPLKGEKKIETAKV